MDNSVRINAVLGDVVVELDVFGVPHIFYDGWEITLTRGAQDDMRVMFVDTADISGESSIPENRNGPECRIYLNDSDLWINRLSDRG